MYHCCWAALSPSCSNRHLYELSFFSFCDVGAKLLPEFSLVVVAGDKMSVRIQGSEQINTEIAAITDMTGAGEDLGEKLKGIVFAGLEDAEALMDILFEHKTWPGQDAPVTVSDHGRMRYRYVMVFSESPENTGAVAEMLTESGYKCVTGFEEYRIHIEKNKPVSAGLLFSGLSFLLCAVYLIQQLKKQRLESNRNRIDMLVDLGWKRTQIRRVWLIDIHVSVLIVNAIVVLNYLLLC